MTDGTPIGDAILLFICGGLAFCIVQYLFWYRLQQRRPKSRERSSMSDFVRTRPPYEWDTFKLSWMFSRYDNVIKVSREERGDEGATTTLVLHLRGTVDVLYVTGYTKSRVIANPDLAIIDSVDICNEFGHDRSSKMTGPTAVVFDAVHMYFLSNGVTLAE